MNIQTIPLDKLRLSPRNVRKTGGASIESLAASIHAHGLLQNLTVSPSADGTFAVEAGNRRWRALQHLKAAGQLADDYGVSCQVLDVDAGQLAEVSLAENIIRHAMHPADEFDAFAALANEGSSVADIAARFGQTEFFIRQRLKLANVAPDILADYRAGDATLEQMMALALTDDQALQSRIWKAAKNDWQREPARLREAITQQELAADSSLAKYIGVAAYEKAGGQVRRDIFGAEEDSFLMDPELAQKLALEKLERTAEKIRKEGWAWAEARLDCDYSDLSRYGRAPSDYKGSKETWSAEAKEHAGALVYIGYNGNAEIKRGLVRPEDRKAVASATGETVSGGKAKPVPGELSFAAVQRLQAEASDIIAVDVSEKPSVAIALLAAELADHALYDGWDGPRTFVHIRREASGRMPGNIAKISGRAPAARRMDEQLEGWKALLPKKRGEARAWILQQDEPTVEKLLAFLVAREIDAVEISAGAKKETVVDLAAAAQTDLSQAWSPSEEWLSTLPKAVVIAMAKDAGAGDVDLAALAKSPKATLAAQALPHFPAGWLPPALRGRAAPKPKAKPKKKSAAPKKTPTTKAASKKKAVKKTACKATSASKSRKAGAK